MKTSSEMSGRQEGSLNACNPARFAAPRKAFGPIGLFLIGSLFLTTVSAAAPDTPIGRAVAAIRDLDPRRFSIRHSGRGGAWGSFTIDFPTARKRIGDAIVCPEQSAAMEGQGGRYCGSCTLCWASDAAIAFVEH